MHQDNHYVDGLDHPDDGGVLGGRVQAVEGSTEGVLSDNSVGPEQCCPAGDTKEQVDNLKWYDTEDIHFEVSILDIILGALFSICFINATGIQEHDPRFDEKNVTPVNSIADIVTYQPVQSVGLNNKLLAQSKLRVNFDKDKEVFINGPEYSIKTSLSLIRGEADSERNDVCIIEEGQHKDEIPVGHGS